MPNQDRSNLEKLIAFIDKYPLYAVLIFLMVLILGFPFIVVWKGKSEKIQEQGIMLYKMLLFDNKGLCVSSLLLTIFCIILYVYSRKIYKKEIHRLSEEKKVLHELLLGKKLPKSGHSEV